jgi:hypothetical protein
MLNIKIGERLPLYFASVDFNNDWAFMLRRLNVIGKCHRRFAERQQPGIPYSSGRDLIIFRRNIRIAEKVIEYFLQSSLQRTDTFSALPPANWILALASLIGFKYRGAGKRN